MQAKAKARPSARSSRGRRQGNGAPGLPGLALGNAVGDLVGMTVAADCAGLAIDIADNQIAAWRAALPEIADVRVEADHNGLAVSEGRRIAELILEIVEDARRPS